jgi:hypothetical protein
MYQDNPIVAIPLSDLVAGENRFEGASGAQTATLDWGQWGWTGIVVRVYYDAAKKQHAAGRITAPRTGETLGENPRVSVKTDRPDEVARVDVLARYEGYDEDGDGYYLDWHRFYSHDRQEPDGPDEPRIRGHAGSAQEAPFEVKWDTRWVPDQRLPEVALLARIQSKQGVWYVTEAVSGMQLRRADETVRLYKPEAVPEKYCARASTWMLSKFAVPPPDFNLEPIESTLHLRSWNGHEKDVWVNGWKTAVDGANHNFAYTRHDLPLDLLRKGENRVEFFSETLEHCIEVLWPGPGVTVRYRKPAE